MDYADFDSVTVTTAPTGDLATLAEAASRIGASPDAPPAGLQAELDQAVALIDGPTGRPGYCFRSWVLRGLLYEWPTAGYVKLPHGSASSVSIRRRGENETLGEATVVERYGESYLEVEDRPAGWLDSYVLQADWTAGPGDAQAALTAKGAALRLVGSLWAERIEPGKGRVADALKDADAALSFYSTRGW